MCVAEVPFVDPHHAQLGHAQLPHTGRSWRHLSGEQLDCFTCITEDAPTGSLQQAALLSSVIGTSADGGVPAASAMAQSDAAKHDMGDDNADDANMGKFVPLVTALRRS